jgi:hypothetical protein
MRTPHKFALTLALITFGSILSFLIAAVRAEVGCTPPPTLGKRLLGNSALQLT